MRTQPVRQVSSQMETVMKALARRLILTTTILASGLFHAHAQFNAPDPDFKGGVSASAAQRGSPIHAGSEVVFSGERFAPGQQATIWRGATQLTSEALTADTEGKFSWTTTIPQDAAVGQHPIVVHAENPSASAVFNIKVSPNIALSGEEKFDILANGLVRGLYQVAYSPKNDALFVTSAVGRPPVEESELLKIDPSTLEITARIKPEAAPAREDGRAGGVYAVYGVGVDDVKDTVWVTNTRQNTVAVYNQSDLSLVKQFEPDAVNHARDVLVDAERGFAYASATGTNVVAVIDTGTLEIVKNIEIETTRSGGRRQQPQEFSAASLDLDVAGGKLYTVSLSTNEVAIIDLETREVDKVIPVNGARSAIGIAHDREDNRIFVAAQGSDTLSIVDAESGETLHDVLVGAGPLNVAFDPVGKLAYVSNRGSGTLTVVSPDGEIIANLDNGSNPNHVIADGKGAIYAINKSRGENDPAGDRISKITPKN